jgi:hypothetical protein
MRLSKYLGLFILENRFELENLLEKIDYTKEKMPDYPWLDEIIASEVIEVFYRHVNTDLMVVDSILHHLHLKDQTLREKTYIFVAYYKNIYINFFTGLMSPYEKNETIQVIEKILAENNITFDEMKIFHTSTNNKISYINEAIYISFLCIEGEIDRAHINKLFEIFPNGYVEE